MGPRFCLGRPTKEVRALRNNATEAEKLLWSRLRGSQLGDLKFSRQMPLAGYRCDFVCRSHKLIVELDGSQHVDAAAYDAQRTANLKGIGLHVIRFWNNDLTANMDGVLEAILSAAAGRGPTPQPPPACGRGST